MCEVRVMDNGQQNFHFLSGLGFHLLSQTWKVRMLNCLFSVISAACAGDVKCGSVLTRTKM